MSFLENIRYQKIDNLIIIKSLFLLIVKVDNIFIEKTRN